MCTEWRTLEGGLAKLDITEREKSLSAPTDCATVGFPILLVFISQCHA